LDNKQASKWEPNHKKVLEAIQKIERLDLERPYALVREIVEHVSSLSREAVHRHLKKLVREGSASKTGAGRYCTPHVLMVKDLCRRILVQQSEIEARLDDTSIDRLVSEDFADAGDLVPSPLKRAFSKGLITQAKHSDRARKQRILERIKKCTRVSIYTPLQAEKIDDLEFKYLKDTISQAVAEFLLKRVLHEQAKRITSIDVKDVSKDAQKAQGLLNKFAELEKDETLWKNCAAQTIIDFDPMRF